jgi:uncharacterized protein (TIGR03546 family)
VIALKLLFKFIRILNKEASPRAIAGGMALGMIIGLTPKGCLHNIIVLILIFMLNVNTASALLAAGVFALFSYLGDPLFNKLGHALLTATPLQGLWTALYNTPLVPWTRFNNTLVLGSLSAALTLFWPVYVLLTWAVRQYREKVLAAVQKWKILQVIKASKLVALYNDYT